MKYIILIALSLLLILGSDVSDAKIKKIDGKIYFDGVEITREEFKLKSKELSKKVKKMKTEPLSFKDAGDWVDALQIMSEDCNWKLEHITSQNIIDVLNDKLELGCP